jgi:hypothetical protein
VNTLLFLLISLLTFTVSAETPKCIPTGQHTQLAGTIHMQTFPGPPNYESIKEGDQPETSWILVTNKSYCAQGEDLINTGKIIIEKNQNRFQLVLTPELYQQEKKLLNKKVLVNGSLFFAHTGHHHTPLLIEVSKIIAP